MDDFNFNADEIDEILKRYSSSEETKPEAVPEIKPEVKPEIKPEIKPEVKPEAKPEKKLGIKRKEKPAAEPAIKYEESPVKQPEESTPQPEKKPERKIWEIPESEFQKPKEDLSTSEYVAKKRKKQRRKRISNTITNALLVIFIVGFLGSGTYLAVYFLRISRAESKFEDLKSMIDNDSHSVAPEGVEDSSSSSDGGREDYLKYVDVDGVSVQSKFANLYTKNRDFVGWLTIADTQIDYPVMYTPDDEEYYLHRDFDKEESSSGTLFLGKGSDYKKPSDNIIIYGHNMKAGTMLGGIIDYETQDFYNAHKTFTFDTIDNNGTYQVIAAFRTAIADDSFRYDHFYNASSKEEFDEFVEKVKHETPYTIDETAVYGDKLLTLSTCSYHANEGRFVVVAKKID